MPTGIDHATVMVRELDAAIEAYTNLLGHGPTWRGGHPELGTQSALFGLSNSLVELVAPAPGDTRADGMRAWLDAHGEGLQALALATDDASRCREQCRARGLRVSPVESGQARSSQDGRVRTYQSFEVSPRDAHGLSVLVVEREDLLALRTAATRAAGAAHALDHIVVRTAQPDLMRRLFGEQLSIRLALDREVGGTRMLFFRVGKVTIEVVHDPAAVDAATFWGLAFRVRDIEAAQRRLAVAGVSTNAIRDGNKPGTRVFTVHGETCGVPTLILEDPSRDAPKPA